jgi:phage repressor protein C with HTH and peptisase S24 domain
MTHSHTCEISHGQAFERVKFHHSLTAWQPCDITQMAESINIDAIRERIVSEMKAKGFSKAGLSKAAGISLGGVRDLLTKTDNPGVGTLHRIAEALQVPFESINGTSGVYLAGKIGAGGAIAYFPDDGEAKYVPRPPLAPGPLMAFQVSGESMLPKYEPGDIIYIRRDHDGVLPEYLGTYCAVHLSDGGTYIKRLTAGSELERYTLRSLNAEDMENVEVIWAAPVLFIMPQRSR